MCCHTNRPDAIYRTIRVAAQHFLFLPARSCTVLSAEFSRFFRGGTQIGSPLPVRAKPASSSAPPQQFVFDAGADMRFDFGVSAPPASLAPPPPPPPPPAAKRDAGARPPRATSDPQVTPDAKRPQVAPSDTDVSMGSEAPPSPPRDFARAEQELLREASDTLAARRHSGRNGDHYALQFPPLGRGGGKGKGGR